MGSLVSCSLHCLDYLKTDAASPELDVKFWKYKAYQDSSVPGCTPSIIPASSIRCQFIRGICRTLTPHVWITRPLDRHAIAHRSMYTAQEDPAT